jgi:hypothetical protein
VPALNSFTSVACRVIQLEDNDVLHMVKGDYAIFNMGQPDRTQAVERVHQVWIPTIPQLPDNTQPKLVASTGS